MLRACVHACLNMSSCVHLCLCAGISACTHVCVRCLREYSGSEMNGLWQSGGSSLGRPCSTLAWVLRKSCSPQFLLPDFVVGSLPPPCVPPDPVVIWQLPLRKLLKYSLPAVLRHLCWHPKAVSTDVPCPGMLSGRYQVPSVEHSDVEPPRLVLCGRRGASFPPRMLTIFLMAPNSPDRIRQVLHLWHTGP